MIQVKVKAPYKIAPALNGDVGCDVLAQEDITIHPMQTVSIPTGVYVELPKGVEVQVRPKSGLSSKGLLVHWGTVDTGYRGEILVTATNLNNEPYENPVWDTQEKMILVEVVNGRPLKFNKGDKIAQLVFKRYEEVEVIEVDEIDSDTERGTNGHGSTGD